MVVVVSQLLENLDILLERAPHLAGIVQSYLDDLGAEPEADPAYDLTSDRLWARHHHQNLNDGCTGIVFGLGVHVVFLRRMSPRTLWVVEPSVDRFVTFLVQFSCLELISQGLMIIGKTANESADELFRATAPVLLPYPRLVSEQRDYFRDMEIHLLSRTARIAEVRAQNRLEYLQEHCGERPGLIEFLRAFPEKGIMTSETINRVMSSRNAPWGRVGRIFVTLNCFH